MPKTSPSRFTMVPLRKSSEPTATRRARIIMAGLGIAGLMGPLALGVTMLNSNQEVDFSEVDPTGRGVADAAAYQMASNETVRVPTAKTFDPESVVPPQDQTGKDAVNLPYPVDDVTWTGFDVNTFTDGNTEQTFEVHKYLLVPDMDEYITDYLVDTGAVEETADEDATAGGSVAPAPSPAPASPAPAPAEKSSAPDDSDAPADDIESDNASMSTSSSESDDEDASADTTPADEESTDEDSEEPATEQEKILDEGVTPYQLEVSVLVTDNGPRLAGAPSLAPWTDAEAAPEGSGDYSNFNTLRAESNTQTARQIGRWAVAYAEDDRETLLDLTGDEDPSHEYVGLGGWAVPDAGSPVQVLYAVNVNDGQQLLRVRVLMEDDRTDTEANENPYRMYSDFDVLVASPETATPQIVSWGAAGSGASLSPYSTAIQK